MVPALALIVSCRLLATFVLYCIWHAQRMTTLSTKVMRKWQPKLNRCDTPQGLPAIKRRCYQTWNMKCLPSSIPTRKKEDFARTMRSTTQELKPSCAPTTSRATGMQWRNTSRAWSVELRTWCHPTWMNTGGANDMTAYQCWHPSTSRGKLRSAIHYHKLTATLPLKTGPFQNHPLSTEENMCTCQLILHAY